MQGCPPQTAPETHGGVPVQPQLTPALQAFSLNLTRRLPHLHQDPQPRQWASLPSGVVFIMCPLLGTGLFWFHLHTLKDSSKESTVSKILRLTSEIWHTLLGAPLLRSAPVKRDLGSSGHPGWSLGPVVSTGDGPPPSLSVKMAMAILIQRNRVHKHVCESILWTTRRWAGLSERGQRTASSLCATGLENSSCWFSAAGNSRFLHATTLTMKLELPQS